MKWLLVEWSQSFRSKARVTRTSEVTTPIWHFDCQEYWASSVITQHAADEPALFSRLLQLPISLGMDLLLTRGEHVCEPYNRGSRPSVSSGAKIQRIEYCEPMRHVVEFTVPSLA